MKHKYFRIFAGVELCILIVLSALYDYFVSTNRDISCRMLFKLLPLLTLLVLNYSYFVIYRVTLYSVINLGALFLCLIGDLFMVLYDPAFTDITQNQIIYLSLGGGFFLLARIMFLFMFLIKPYKVVSLITYSKKKLLISHICFTTPFAIISILNLIYNSSLVSFLASIYIFIGFGLPLSYAFLRIGKLRDIEIQESNISSVLGFSGFLLFNLSDLLLFIALFTNLVPSYVILISDNIYWLAMYLLTISVVRSKDEYIEKDIEM